MSGGSVFESSCGQEFFIFISILIMTQLHPRDPENGQVSEPILGTAILWKNSYNRYIG